MARSCKKCSKPFKTRVVIGGKHRHLANRKYCFSCSPFGSGNTKKLEIVKAPKRVRDAVKYKKWQRKARAERKQRLVAMFGGKCAKCGYSRCVAALTFHHRDPRTKRFQIGSAGLLRNWKLLVAEARKCDLLCCNCHAEKHHKDS